MKPETALVLLLLAGCADAPQGPAPAGPPEGIYDRDPQHLWNRLHRQISTWSGNVDPRLVHQPDGLLWPVQRHDLNDEAWMRAVPLLDEFLEKKGETLIPDPLKRLVLQSALWLLFDATASPAEERDEAMVALQRKIVAVLRRIALTPKQVEQLPDTLAESRGKFATHYDPEWPKLAFLPPDLDDEDGPWVRLAADYADGQPLALHHASFSGGRQTFMIYLRGPGKRSETLEWLKKLPRGGSAVPEGLSRIAVGTQLALVRRLVAITTDGKMHPTGVVESLQLRTYLPEPPPEEDRDGWQSFAMFRLHRRDLLLGKGGGLRALTPESLESAMVLLLGREKLAEPAAVLRSCTECHVGNGLGSILSMAPLYFQPTVKASGGHETPRWGYRPLVIPASEEEALFGPIVWKREQFSWGLLQALWQ